MQLPIPSDILAFHSVAGAMNAVEVVRDTTKTTTPIPTCLTLMMPKKADVIGMNINYRAIESNIETRDQVSALCNAIDRKGRFR